MQDLSHTRPAFGVTRIFTRRMMLMYHLWTIVALLCLGFLIFYTLAVKAPLIIVATFFSVTSTIAIILNYYYVFTTTWWRLIPGTLYMMAISMIVLVYNSKTGGNPDLHDYAFIALFLGLCKFILTVLQLVSFVSRQIAF